MNIKNKKILVVHNRYQSTGGEDIAVDEEVKFLSKFFDVRTLFFTNDLNNIFTQIKNLVLNKNLSSQKIIENELKSFKPDYCIVHNTWFEASLSIFEALDKRDIKTFIKLHNYRHECCSSFLAKKHLAGQKTCNACSFSKNRFQFFNKYYPESYIKSFLIIRYARKYLKILKSNKYKLLVFGDFQKNRLIDLGVNKDKIEIFPNYIPPMDSVKTDSNDKYIVYAGRISKDKGVDELINSFINANLKEIKLKIVGDGPDLNNLQKKYIKKNIEFLGKKSHQETLRYLSSSLGVITATKTFEGQPTLLCEASQLGKISIFPRTGTISDFFVKDYEFSFSQFNYHDLTTKIIKLINLKNKKVVEEQNKNYILNYLAEDILIKKLVNILKDF